MQRLQWRSVVARERHTDFAAEVRAGLSARQKSLPCAWLYDEVGSRLFEAICALPEYYPTRCEEAILREQAARIAERVPVGADLVELGSGSSTKTRILIDELLRTRRELRYVPLDISASMLEASAESLLRERPQLSILAVAAEYQDGLRILREECHGPRCILWLGSNVGNFERAAAARFLVQLRAGMGGEDALLIGIDLRKDPDVLRDAYDDPAGVTAAFDKNLLARINRELGGDFDLSAFAHRAPYDVVDGRIEMRLECLRPQRVSIAAVGGSFDFAAGETIHTENSYKYSLQEIDALAAAAGFTVADQWLDPRAWFSVQRLVPR